jgi:hypothetical protein
VPHRYRDGRGDTVFDRVTSPATKFLQPLYWNGATVHVAYRSRQVLGGGLTFAAPKGTQVLDRENCASYPATVFSTPGDMPDTQQTKSSLRDVT